MERSAELLIGNVGNFTLVGSENNSLAGMELGFDFEAAKRAHRSNRVKIRSLISDAHTTNLDKRMTDPKLCELGKWLASAGQQYSSNPVFHSLQQSHDNYHAYIGKIFQHKEIGDHDGANQMADKIEEMVNQVISLIDQFQAEVVKGSQASGSGRVLLDMRVAS
ncbi:hypothetical protein THIOSC13_1670009 [uncultured Thiomicrorhabdus sp.]